MGARSVIAALAMYQHLDHAPMRLLVGMAVHCLDEDSDEYPAGRSFLGENSLMEIVGCGKSALYEHLKALREAGAITTVVKGRAGKRAVYQLHVDPLQGPASGRPGPCSVRESRTQSVRESRTHSLRETRTPRRTEEPLEEINFKENSSPAVPQGWMFGDAGDDEGFTYEQASKAVQAKHGAARAYEVAEQFRQQNGLDDIKAATIALAQQEAAA